MLLCSQDLSEKNLTPALFLHVQKTAGSSIIELARHYYGDTNVSSHGEYLGKKPEELSDKLFISGHFGYDYARHFMATRYSFTILRNPAERILSLYFFCKTRNANEYPIYQIAQNVSLEEFLQAGLWDHRIKTHIWNNEVWQLAQGFGRLDNRTLDDFSPEELLNLAIDHLDKFSHVGFTETFEHDKKTILSALGIPESATEECVNVVENRPTADNLSSSESILLEELTVLDRALYEYAWSHRIT